MNEISVHEIDGRLNALTNQRNEALNQVVVLHGVLTVKERQIAELEEKLKALTPAPAE